MREERAERIRAAGRNDGLTRAALAEPDPAEIASIRRNLALTPTERLDQLVRTVAFVRAGRAAVRKRRGSLASRS